MYLGRLCSPVGKACNAADGDDHAYDDVVCWFDPDRPLVQGTSQLLASQVYNPAEAQ